VLEALGDLPAAEPDGLDREVLLAAGEVVVERALRRAAGGEDRFQSGRGVALAPEEVGGRRRSRRRGRWWFSASWSLVFSPLVIL
jgi:hypothetical protein